MLDDLRHRLGYRAALRAVQQRTVRGWPAGPHERKVLILLPTEEEALRAAWRFVRTLDEPVTHLIPALAAERVAYVPDAFAGAVFTVGEKGLDWRGLPRRVISDALWTQRPHVAVDLNPTFGLAAAYLVGASPARFRVGLHSAEGEPFYDLMVARTGGYAEALAALRGYLAAVEPSVVAFHA